MSYSRTLKLLICFLFVMLVSPDLVTQAQTSSASDYATLRTLINTSTVSHITLTNDIMIDDSVIKAGNNAFPNITRSLVIDGGGNKIIRESTTTQRFRFFEIRGSGNLRLENIVLEGGAPPQNQLGGAIHVLSGQLYVMDSVLINNHAQEANGGAISNSINGQVTIVNSDFINNVSTVHGGAITNNGNNARAGTLTIENSRFVNNEGFNGGAIHNLGNLTLTDSFFSINEGQYGGAIATENGSVTLENITLDRNHAVARGGGLFMNVLNPSAQATVTNSTLNENTAGLSGSAIEYKGGNITLNHLTIKDASTSNQTLINNDPSDPTAQITITNSILYGMTAICLNPLAPASANNVTNQPTHNCATGIVSSALTPSHLGQLADNGGTTQTIALLAVWDNPAINASATGATTHDQRGVPAQGTRDVGAYELQIPTVEFVDATQSAYEGDGSLDVGIRVFSGTTLPIYNGTLALILATSGTATTINDYTILPNPVVINYDCLGLSSCDVVIPDLVTLIDDAIIELDKTLILTTDSILAGELGTSNTHTITIMDNDYPVVVNVVDVNGNTIDGAIYDADLDQMTIQFSDDVFDDGAGFDPDSASNPANYILLSEGAVAGFQTVSCVAGISPDDTQIPVSVSYDSATFVSTLTFNPALTDGNYQLLICGTTSIVSAINPVLHLNNGVDVPVNFAVNIPVIPTATPVTPTVEPTATVELTPTVLTPTVELTAQPTILTPTVAPTLTPVPFVPEAPAQPENLGVVELPATGERPLWAELLGRSLGR